MRQSGLIATASGDNCRMDAQLGQRPRGKFGVDILGGIGKGSEDDDLAVAGIERVPDFLRDDFSELGELGVAG